MGEVVADDNDDAITSSKLHSRTTEDEGLLKRVMTFFLLGENAKDDELDDEESVLGSTEDRRGNFTIGSSVPAFDKRSVMVLIVMWCHCFVIDSCMCDVSLLIVDLCFN